MGERDRQVASADTPIPTGSTVLLNGLEAGEGQTAWRRLVDRYGPLVASFARKLGLPDADVADAVQETMAAFVRAWRGRQFDHTKGGLRKWLLRVASCKVADIQRRNARHAAAANPSSGTGLLDMVPAPDQWERIWEQEWRDAVLRDCMAQVARQVSPTTLAAFELYVIREMPVATVAERLGVTPNAVYIAKARVLDRIRKARQRVEDEW